MRLFRVLPVTYYERSKIFQLRDRCALKLKLVQAITGGLADNCLTENFRQYLNKQISEPQTISYAPPDIEYYRCALRITTIEQFRQRSKSFIHSPIPLSLDSSSNLKELF